MCLGCLASCTNFGCDSIGLVGDGELRFLVVVARSPEAPQGEDGGRGCAGRMGRGQSRPVQLHPCRRDADDGFSQEGTFS